MFMIIGTDERLVVDATVAGASGSVC